MPKPTMDRNAVARSQFRQKVTQPAKQEGLLEGAQEEMSAEEKKLVEQAVQLAGKQLYAQGKDTTVAEFIKDPPHVQAIGDTAAQITQKVDEQMNLPEDLIIPVGILVAEMVSDLGEEAGFYKESEDFVRQCIQFTLKKLYEIYGIDQEGLEQVAGEYAPGELGSGLSGGAEPAEGAPAPGGEEDEPVAGAPTQQQPAKAPAEEEAEEETDVE